MWHTRKGKPPTSSVSPTSRVPHPYWTCWLLGRNLVFIGTAALKSSRTWGCHGSKGVFLHPCNLQNGQQMNNLLPTLLLPSEIAVIKTEAHPARTDPEHQGSAPADLHTVSAAAEFIKIVAHVDGCYRASARDDPSLPSFCHRNILETW